MRAPAGVHHVAEPRHHVSHGPGVQLPLQIHGDKVMYVFDRYDREVLPEEEIERFWSADNNAAVYKEQYQSRGREYHMRPGMGVHIPVNAPHWLKNGDNISVTLAVTFQFMDSCLANVYRTNYYLRKVGIRPVPPGRSRMRDTLKAWTMGGAIGARNILRRVLRRHRPETQQAGQCS